MFGLLFSFGPLTLILKAVAIIHFIRRRPDTYWLWIIIIGGSLGPLVYIVMEVVPDLGLLRQSMQVFPRRRRIRIVEGMVHDNPSPGNFEELADLYLEERRFSDARACYDRVIAGSRTDLLDPRYRRGICAIEMGDFAAALEDLEKVHARDPKYGSYRAAGLLAHAYAKTGRSEEAEELFKTVTAISTMSEAYCNYAEFLATQRRTAEAREWAQKVLDKKRTMPRYLIRVERPWMRRAAFMLKRLPG